MLKRVLVLLSFASVLVAGLAAAEVTKVVVRVKSRDAKFVGTSMGGARVVIREAGTGEVLARGVTRGGTGNTKRIMVEPWPRRQALSDASAAKFEAELDLSEPVFVTVEVHAPLAQKQSAVTASTQLWLIPGKHIAGDGVLIEVPGFVVDILTPQTPDRVKIESGEATIPIKANVVMMCGCPVTEGGLWDAQNYQVAARLKHNGVLTAEIPLAVTEKASLFAGEAKVSEPGTYEIIVYAYDEQMGNTGVDKAIVRVVE